MLNAVHGRKQWLTDVCIERILPDPPPRRHANGANGDVTGNGVNGDAEEGGAGGAEGDGVGRLKIGHDVPVDPEERRSDKAGVGTRPIIARVGLARVVLPPLTGNGVEPEDIWG
jgi:hypothetical protein